MRYELAKELKDAGFSQHQWTSACDEWCCDTDNHIHYPTLSELIEACGDKFYSLHVADGWTDREWFATLTHDDRKSISNEPYRKGATPEEAVAHLWLALNKK